MVNSSSGPVQALSMERMPKICLGFSDELAGLHDHDSSLSTSRCGLIFVHKILDIACIMHTGYVRRSHMIA